MRRAIPSSIIYCSHNDPFVEVVDLTDAANVALFRKWDQKDSAYIQQLRFIRISSAQPDVFTVSRYGQHFSLAKPPKPVPAAAAAGPSTSSTEVAMEEDEAPLLLEPIARFSSTIMGMDEIPS